MPTNRGVASVAVDRWSNRSLDHVVQGRERERLGKEGTGTTDGLFHVRRITSYQDHGDVLTVSL